MSSVSRLEFIPEWQHSLTFWEYQDFVVVGFAFVSVYVEIDCKRTIFTSEDVSIEHYGSLGIAASRSMYVMKDLAV